MESINFILNNVFFSIYSIIFFYLITPNKVSKLKDIWIYILSCLVIVFPYTIKIEEYILFNFISNSMDAGAFVAPIEELTKLIPLLILILYKRNEEIKLSDFIFVGAISGIIFTVVENLFYFRCSGNSIIPIASFHSEYLDYYIEFSHIVATTTICGLIGIFITCNKNKLHKILWGMTATIFTIYQVFEHYFYNYTLINSFLGVIEYNKNDFLAKVHDILGQNRFTIVILIALIVYAYWSEARFKKANKIIIKDYIKNNKYNFTLILMAIVCFIAIQLTYVDQGYIYLLEGLKKILETLFEAVFNDTKTRIDTILGLAGLCLLYNLSDFKTTFSNAYIWFSNSKLGNFIKNIMGDKAYYNTAGVILLLGGIAWDCAFGLIVGANFGAPGAIVGFFVGVINGVVEVVTLANDFKDYEGRMEEYMEVLANNDFKKHISKDIAKGVLEKVEDMAMKELEGSVRDTYIEKKIKKQLEESLKDVYNETNL